MAYPMRHDTRPQSAQGNPYATNQEATRMLRRNLAENMAAGLSREEAHRNAQIAMMGAFGGFSPLQLGILGASVAVPTGVAMYKSRNRQQERPAWQRQEGLTQDAADLFTGSLSDEAIYGGPYGTGKK